MPTEDAEHVSREFFKLALFRLVRLMQLQGFFYQAVERASGRGDRFVDVIGPDGNSVLFGFGFEIHDGVNG
jgi:hypothetical protein